MHVNGRKEKKRWIGMNPLSITVAPELSLDLGDKNLQNYIDTGYNHIQINSDKNAMQALNRVGLIEKGFPYFGWLVSIKSAVIRLAVQVTGVDFLHI